MFSVRVGFTVVPCTYSKLFYTFLLVLRFNAQQQIHTMLTHWGNEQIKNTMKSKKQQMFLNPICSNI